MAKYTNIPLAPSRLPDGETPCRFCAGEEPSRRATRAGVGAWKDFTFEQLGHDYDTPPPLPPRVTGGKIVPLVRVDSHPLSFSRPTNPLAATSWTLANGYRIVHKSGLLLFVHWWPSHGFKAEITNLQPAGFALVNKILKLFKPELRGGPKIAELDLVKAIQKAGEGATLTSVAKELGVTRQALQFWTRRGGMKSWEIVKEHYGNSEAR
jgi:hypothetical protein